MASHLTFVPEEKRSDGSWEETHVFHWRMEEDEMAVIYAACCVRIRNLREAEENLKNYRHVEPLRIAGKTKMVEFHNAVPALSQPFCPKMKHGTGTKAGDEEFAKILAQSPVIVTSKEVGLQALASMGWLMDITKARPPEITNDTTSVDYEEKLLPSNLEVKEESAPSGYNKAQISMLDEARDKAVIVLRDCGDLAQSYEEMGVVKFGTKVFKAYSKVFGALPDPEEEERKRFEGIKEEAKARKEDPDD
jgi:hypothetical protein